MKIYKYGFTGKRVSEAAEFAEASTLELKLLIALMDASGECTDEQLIEKCGCSRARLSAAIALWEEAEIIKLYEDEAVYTPYGNVVKEDFSSPSALSYAESDSVKEIVRTIRDHKLAGLFDECAALLGKPMLSPNEIRCLAELSSQYALSDEYIAMLAAHFAQKGTFTVRLMATRAMKLAADGITTPEELKSYLAAKEAKSQAFMEYRRLLGIYDRALSPTEKKYFEKWSLEYCFGTEIVGLAYDMSVANTSKRNLKYMDTLLTDWRDNACKTVSECEARYEATKPSLDKAAPSAEKKYTPAAKPKKERFGDFDPEEAMRRAIERSSGKKSGGDQT